MMIGPEILRDIVIKISSDRNKLRGTGFFISKDEIATCYHVLANKGGQLLDNYYIKNHALGEWIEVKPLKEKSRPPPQDIAFLQCPIPLKLGDEEIPFFPWNGRNREFRSRGYDCNITPDEGASTIDGEDCLIIDYWERGGESRLQLRTIKKTLLPGRSGSPVWSMGQNAVVGMIDYQAGDENIMTDRSMAIPIETLIPSLKDLVIDSSQQNESDDKIFDQLLEWKLIHTKMQASLNSIAPVVSFLDLCQFSEANQLEKQLYLTAKAWTACTPSIKEILFVINGFSHISKEKVILQCMAHAENVTSISFQINEARESSDVKSIQNSIGSVKEDFETALRVADLKIVNMVDELAKRYRRGS